MKRKSQVQIVKDRKIKSKKIEILCTKQKTFKPKRPINSKVLFKYANDDSFLEIASTKVGIEFIASKMKVFKQFVKYQQLYDSPSREIINNVFQGQALNSYMEKYTAIKASEENYRLKAMSVAKIYFDYKIPIQENLYITEIRTRKIQCNNKMKYTLSEDLSGQLLDTHFQFCHSYSEYCDLDSNAADLAVILLTKLPIVPIIGQIVYFLYCFEY